MIYSFINILSSRPVSTIECVNSDYCIAYSHIRSSCMCNSHRRFVQLLLT